MSKKKNEFYRDIFQRALELIENEEHAELTSVEMNTGSYSNTEGFTLRFKDKINLTIEIKEDKNG